MSIGEKLKKRRKRQNLTQKQLADKVGISLMSIQRYERDQRQPTVEILEKICDALDTSVINFMGLFEKDRPQSERDLFDEAIKNIPNNKFWYGRTELNLIIKREMLESLDNIAKISKISIEDVYAPEIERPVFPITEIGPPKMAVVDGGQFDGIIVTYKDKKFKISAKEYYKLADRIIESVAVNILAAETYKKE